MRIIKPSKRPGKGQLNRQAHSSSSDISERGEQDSKRETNLDHEFDELNDRNRRALSSGGLQGVEAECPAKARKKHYLALQSKAIRLLAMREHSTKELHTKLASKADGYLDLVDSVIEEMLSEGYLSDERYTESYTRSRLARGFGPVKIKLELKTKGVDEHLANDHIDARSGKWLEAAMTQYQKKYADMPIASYNEWTKRARFLQSRGFTMDHIHSVMPEVVHD